MQDGDYSSLLDYLTLSYIASQILSNLEQTIVSSPFVSLFLGLFLGKPLPDTFLNNSPCMP